MKKLNITFCSFPDFSSNAKALYDYMKEVYNDKMNLVWIVTSDEMMDKLKEKNIKAYKLGTEEYFEYVKETDVFFTTHCNILGEKNKDAIYVELWHGISSKHIGFLSDNMSKEDEEWYNSIRKKVDYFIVPSDFWRVIFATRFNVRYNRVLSLGYPKLDYFIGNNAKELLSKVIKIDVNNYSKIIYYMPTFRKGCNRPQESNINIQNILNLQSYKEENLLNYLKKNNYLLCIKKHPSEEIDLKQIETNNIKIITEEKLNENNINLNQILAASDLMITDYSSLGIEYTFFNKPLIYCVTDFEEYSKNRGVTFNNFEFWTPGYKVNNLNMLFKALEESFENNKYSKIVEEKKNLWFGKLTDGGCADICNFLFKGNNVNENINKYIDDEEKLQNRVDELSVILDEKNELIAQREKRIKELDDFIAEIINSKGWKFLESIRKVFSIKKKGSN